MKLGESELRPVMIKKGHPASGSFGIFHSWCKEPFYNESGIYLTKTFALIELSDGNVQFLEPDFIKFTNPLLQRIENQIT
jgi:hypothetical protein